MREGENLNKRRERRRWMNSKAVEVASLGRKEKKGRRKDFKNNN